MPMLEMSQVSYCYPGAGAPAVVRQVDWVLPKAEFHCLLGRSGCGKTSLLKLAAGLLHAQHGQVTVHGHGVPQPGARLGADVGFVFQAPNLLEWLSVLDNVLLPITLHRVPSAQERALAHGLLAQMGMGKLVQQHPRQLSGGQQSRVAIERALVTEPSLLLMDEPFAALDAITREDLQDLLQTLCSAQGRSVLFVTHDISEAVYLADRVAVMQAGQIICNQPVPLPRPRRQAMRYGGEFNAICASLRAAMDGVPA